MIVGLETRKRAVGVHGKASGCEEKVGVPEKTCRDGGHGKLYENGVKTGPDTKSRDRGHVGLEMVSPERPFRHESCHQC